MGIGFLIFVIICLIYLWTEHRRIYGKRVGILLPSKSLQQAAAAAPNGEKRGRDSNR
jgi:hypothetical protein